MQSDVIIISDCKSHKLRQMTKECINSLIDSEKQHTFNLIIIESSDIEHKGCITIHPKIPFNYNGYINIGLKKCKSEFITFCNNDLIFQSGWFTSHLDVFENNADIMSLSPKCPLLDGEIYKNHEDFKVGIYEGYRPRYELTGWCITARKTVFDKIKRLKTLVNFWCSDDIYAMQLIRKKLKHALNADSKVQHLFGASRKTLSIEEHENYTKKQLRIFNNYKKSGIL